MGFGSVSRTDCLFISRPSVLPDAKQSWEKETGRTKMSTMLLTEATCSQWGYLRNCNPSPFPSNALLSQTTSRNAKFWTGMGLLGWLHRHDALTLGDGLLCESQAWNWNRIAINQWIKKHVQIPSLLHVVLCIF